MRGHINRSLSSSEVHPRMKLGLRHRENSTLSLATLVGNRATTKANTSEEKKPATDEKLANNIKPTSVLPMPGELQPRRNRVNSSFHQMRWVVISMCGTGMFLVFFLRLSITVAIIDMVNQTHVPVYYQYPNHTNASVLGKLEEALEEEVFIYDWDNTIQNFLMSIYMIGYGIPQVPLSIIIEKRGGLKITGISQTIGLIATALVPHVAHFGWGWVALLRLITGAAHSTALAVGIHMIDLWIPASEKSIAVTTFQFLSSTGYVFNPLLSGYLTAYNWTFAFYGPALIAFIWVIVWFSIVSDKPEDCWLVSQKELEFIKSNNNYCQQPSCKLAGEAKKDAEFPWKKFAKTPCVYAFLFIWVMHCSTGLGFAFMLPRFLMSSGIGVDDISENGRVNFYIQLGSLMSYIWGYTLFSYLLKKNFSRINARRVVYTLSAGFAALGWILPSFVDGSPVWMCLMNRIAQPITEVIVLGSVMDNFSAAGISTSVFGILNTLANCANFPVGVTLGKLLDVYEESLTCWHLMLSAMSLVLVLSLVTYYIMIDTVPIKFDDTNSNTDIESGEEKDPVGPVAVQPIKVANIGSTEPNVTDNKTVR